MRTLPLLALPLMLTFHCAGASFLADFNSGADSRLYISQAAPVCEISPCETITYPSGVVQFNFTGGGTLAKPNNMNMFLRTGFGLVGNYTVSVDVWSESVPNMWPALFSAGWLQVGGSTATAVEWATSPSQAYEWVDAPSLNSPLAIADLATEPTGGPLLPITFEIQRTVTGGTATVTMYYNLHDGNGLQILFAPVSASADPTGPVMFGLAGYGTGAFPASITFDDLRITADGFAPEPATWSFGLAAGLLGLALQRQRNRESAR